VIDTDTFRIDVAPTDDGGWTALCTLPNGRTWSYDRHMLLEVLMHRIGQEYEAYSCTVTPPGQEQKP
jgi:hypothetical protein